MVISCVLSPYSPVSILLSPFLLLSHFLLFFLFFFFSSFAFTPVITPYFLRTSFPLFFFFSCSVIFTLFPLKRIQPDHCSYFFTLRHSSF
jgi:hypothetical protein